MSIVPIPILAQNIAESSGVSLQRYEWPKGRSAEVMLKGNISVPKIYKVEDSDIKMGLEKGKLCTLIELLEIWSIV